jgi:hypothetical protein
LRAGNVGTLPLFPDYTHGAGVGTQMKEKDYAAPLWDRAEECRALANLSTNAQQTAEYLNLAQAYLQLAAHEEKLAKRRERLNV